MGAGGIAANACRGTMIEMKNSKLAINQNNDEAGKISELVRPKNNNTKVSRKIPGTTSVTSGVARDTIKGIGPRASGLPLQSSSSSSSCSNTALQGVKRTPNRAPQSSAGTQLRQPTNLDPTKNKRLKFPKFFACF
ncbi:unnamed protein product [Acanthocheilonema viteae]|uniref:Uncharacterized protein n=1 Tax=Acanthocheilonema viteae TaxID=6277 RepID=A0A498SYX4_ACAVI|nr:unnamed protein product [Acanthocheilonema viteae]